MLELLNLPNELLCQISEQVHRDDIENFAIACRKIFELSKGVLVRHRSRKRFRKMELQIRFGNNFLGDLESGECRKYHPGHLLVSLLADHEIAAYISALRVTTSGSDEQEPDDDSGFNAFTSLEEDEVCDPLRAEMELYKERIRSILQKSSCTEDEDDVDEFFEMILAGHQGATVGLIISLLPNLSHLTLDGFLDGAAVLDTMLQNILSKKRDHEQALTSVTDLEIDSRDGNIGSNRSNFVEPLARMSSLKRFSGIALESYGQRMGDEIDRPCSIEELEIEDCFFDMKGLLRVFGKPILLRKLYYRRTVSPSFGDENFLFTMIEWLRLYAGGMLEKIIITEYETVNNEHHEEGQDYLGSFRSFKKLKLLRLPAILCSERVKHQDGSKCVSMECLCGRRYARALASILPFSLEELILEGGVFENMIPDMFEGFGDVLQKLFPKLSRIRVNSFEIGDGREIGLTEELISSLKGAGVRVWIWSKEV